MASTSPRASFSTPLCHLLGIRYPVVQAPHSRRVDDARTGLRGLQRGRAGSARRRPGRAFWIVSARNSGFHLALPSSRRRLRLWPSSSRSSLKRGYRSQHRARRPHELGGERPRSRLPGDGHAHDCRRGGPRGGGWGRRDRGPGGRGRGPPLDLRARPGGGSAAGRHAGAGPAGDGRGGRAGRGGTCGIVDGRGLVAALALGASGAQLGTRFC